MVNLDRKADLKLSLLQQKDSPVTENKIEGPAAPNSSQNQNAETDFLKIQELSKVPKDNKAKAILFMNLQAIFGCMAALTFKKIAREGVSVIEFSLARNLFNFVMIQCCLWYWNLNPIRDFPKHQKLFLGLRATFGQTGFLLFQLIVLFIPLMLEMVILQTSPFWTSILGLLINRERVQKFEYLAMVICFGCVISMLFSKPSTQSTYSESTRLTGIMLAFVLSWVFSATCVFNRRLKDVHFAVVLFYHCIFGISAATIVIIGEKLITGNPFRIYTGRQYAFLLLCCAFDWLSLSLQTIAF